MSWHTILMISVQACFKSVKNVLVFFFFGRALNSSLLNVFGKLAIITHNPGNIRKSLCHKVNIKFEISWIYAMKNIHNLNSTFRPNIKQSRGKNIYSTWKCCLLQEHRMGHRIPNLLSSLFGLRSFAAFAFYKVCNISTPCGWYVSQKCSSLPVLM